MKESTPGGARLDGLIIASIAVVAYCATNLIHEGLGHGAGCLLGGGFAGGAAIGLRLLRNRPGPLHYVCWLMLALNLLRGVWPWSEEFSTSSSLPG